MDFESYAVGTRVTRTSDGMHNTFDVEHVAAQEELPATSGIFEGIAHGALETGKGKVSTSCNTSQENDVFVSPAVAFEKFKDKNFNPDTTKETDYSVMLRDRGDYSVNRVSAPGVDTVLLETPSERVSRLKIEVNEMLEYLRSSHLPTRQQQQHFETPSKIDVEQQENLETANVSKTLFYPECQTDPLALLQELEALRDQLEQMDVAQYMSTSIPPTDVQAQGTSAPDAVEVSALDLFGTSELLLGGQKHKHVLSSAYVDAISAQLAAFQAHLDQPPDTQQLADSAARGAEEQPCGNGNDSFTYELYTAPSYAQVLKFNRILELERRVTDLENLLGLEKSSHLNLPFPDLSSAVKEIISRLALLHPGRIESLIKRFQNLSAQVDDFFHRKERMSIIHQTSPSRSSDPEKADNPDAIQELYQFWESSRAVAAGLPVVVKRLKALKALHQDAAQVGDRLKALETQQDEVAQMLSAAERDLDELRASLSSTTEWTKTIVATIRSSLPASS